MKPSHRFVLLMLYIVLLALLVSLPATNIGQAAPSGQSPEDRIRATLEDAAAALGGGFEWEAPGFFGMVRTNQIAGYSQSQEAVHFVEKISIYIDDYWCEQRDFEPYTFHGMNGCLLGWEGEPIIGVIWQPQSGLELEGNVVSLQVSSILDYGCSGTDCGDYGQNIINHFHLAEALHQAAIKNGLYEPIPEEIMPIDPGEAVPDYSESPIDPTHPTETDGPFDIPLAIILGSLGIPVLGALVGSVLSTVLSGLSSAGSASTPASNAVASAPPATTVKPKIGDENHQGEYWSERPWDEAGPELVSEEEHEPLLTNDIQDEIDLVEDIEEDWQTSEQNEVELQKPKKADHQPIPKHLADLNADFKAIAQELKKEKVYVLNPYQGDPTVLFHKLNTVKNMLWDKTGAHLTGSQGLTCEGYVRKTHKKVAKAVSKRFPGAKTEQYVIEEKSSVKPQGVLDWFDSLVVDNHILTKVTLPDGSEWAVDFHQHAAGNSPIMRPWSETRKAWKDNYMGDEYMEGLNELK